MTSDDAAFPVSKGTRLCLHLLLVALSLTVLLPLAVVVGAAFKPAGELLDARPWPAHPTLENFRVIVFETPVLTYFVNSLVTTMLRVLGQLAIALLAAYGFARFRFRWRGLLFAIVLGAMLIPHLLTMVPIYMMMTRLGWFDSWAGLVIPNLATPFGAFLLRQHLKSIPDSLFDAATLDGAGHFRALWSIALPMMWPAISTLAIVQFVECWNEYFWPLLVAPDEGARTLQVGLRAFLEQDYSDYGALMAGVTLASLPALLVFALLHRRMMLAFTHSGMTG